MEAFILFLKVAFWGTGDEKAWRHSSNAVMCAKNMHLIDSLGTWICT